jgi:UDP-glucose 4-epimerase
VFGDGSQTRCFCHVQDVIGALMRLVDTPQSIGEVFNIGSTEEVSILQLAETVKRLASSSSEIIFVPYDEAYEEGFEDMPRRVPDTTKVDALVGFTPTYTLENIIRSVIEYQRGTSTTTRLSSTEPVPTQSV